MKLDIIVTHYKEPETTVAPLLWSIENQRLVNKDDFRVIIVNDGRDCVLSDSFLSKFTFNKEYIVADWGGVSHARNVGFDASEAEYVMWCDCDDCFCSTMGLNLLMKYIDKGNFDILNSVFYEEVGNPKDGDDNFILHNNTHNEHLDSVFVHGKLFRRQFLIDNNIRWNDDLKFNEDVYFIQLAQAMTDKQINNTTPFYMWCNNMASVTRSHSVDIENYEIAILKTARSLTQQFLDRGKPLFAQKYILKKLYACYCICANDSWCCKIPDKERNLREKYISMFYKEYGKYLKDMPQNVQRDIMKRIRSSAFDNFFLYEPYTFTEWLKKLDNLEITE